MPESFRPGQDQPEPAEQQIDDEIIVAQTGQAIVGAFGGEYHHQAGGGGADGYYEFTSLAELDEIITELKALRDDIGSDGRKLDQAHTLIRPPAEDIMSVLQADATVASIGAAHDHNRRMWAAADAEIAKLETARTAYAQVENANVQSFRMRG